MAVFVISILTVVEIISITVHVDAVVRLRVVAALDHTRWLVVIFERHICLPLEPIGRERCVPKVGERLLLTGPMASGVADLHMVVRHPELEFFFDDEALSSSLLHVLGPHLLLKVSDFRRKLGE